MAATAPLGLARATTPAGAAAWNTADEPTLARLLDRVTWGNTPQGAQALPPQGVAAYLAAQLRPPPATLPRAAQAQIDAMAITRTPLPELAARMEAQHQAAKAQPTEDGRKAALKAWQQDMRALQQEAAERFVLRALYSPTQLREKMTWFWMNHFSVFAGKGNLRVLVGDYEERAIRPHALGRFRDLLGATVRHPAMLHYLDNARNAAGRINENYARELMELHTLGVDGGYSQQDVQELARVLTGVGIARQPDSDEPPRMKPALRRHYVRDGLFEFNPQRHDWEPKTLLGQPLRAEGLGEVDEALDRLARAPATARFITRKIALFLVGDKPPPALLQTLARTFERTDGDIAAVLEALFNAPCAGQPAPGPWRRSAARRGARTGLAAAPGRAPVWPRHARRLPAGRGGMGRLRADVHALRDRPRHRGRCGHRPHAHPAREGDEDGRTVGIAAHAPTAGAECLRARPAARLVGRHAQCAGAGNITA
jgi:uncharacterized protein (DUF1800 family)